MSLPKVLVTRRIPQAGLDLLAGKAEVHLCPQDAPLDAGDLRRLLPGCQAAVTLLTDRMGKDTLALGAPGLKVVSNYAAGLDNIDLPAATRQGVLVAHTPGVLTEATADLAFALMLAAARRVPEGHAMMQGGEWKGWAPDLLLGGMVHGKTLGIVGMGRIGRAVARRAAGFSMRVLALKRDGKPCPEVDGVAWVGLTELLHESDFVSLHCPLKTDNWHMLGEAQLRRMKKGAYLINTARGPLVDEAALYTVLKDGHLAGAGLDVYEAEPAVHPGLKELPGVVLLPHLGSATVETRNAMAAMACQAVVDALEGRRPEHLANPEAWKS